MARYEYYQPNIGPNPPDFDCSVRAVSKILKINWIQAFDLLTKYARSRYSLVGDIFVTEDALKIYGFKVLGPKELQLSQKMITISEFCDIYPEGIYLVCTLNHVVAVIDGVYYDTIDCGNEKLRRAYEITFDGKVDFGEYSS